MRKKFGEDRTWCFENMIADRQRQTDRQTRSSQYSVNDNEPGAAAKSRHHVRAIDKATTKLEVAITSSSSFKHSSVVNAAVKIPRRRIPATGTRTLRCRAHRGAASRGAPWYGPSLAHGRPAAAAAAAAAAVTVDRLADIRPGPGRACVGNSRRRSPSRSPPSRHVTQAAHDTAAADPAAPPARPPGRHALRAARYRPTVRL